MLPESDARLALAALLVRIARSDNDYAKVEKDRIDRLLVTRYGVPEAEASDIREKAEILEDEAPDTVRFTNAIKDAVEYEDRRAVVEILWQVVLADGHRTKEEDALMRMVSSFLGVSDVDSALARQKAARS